MDAHSNTETKSTEIYRVAYFYQVLLAIPFAFVAIIIYLGTVSSSNLQSKGTDIVLALICIITLATIHFGSRRIIISNDSLYKKKYFGLVSRQVDLKQLANINMSLAYWDRSNITYRLILADRSGKKVKFWISFFIIPLIHNQAKMVNTINKYAQQSGAVYNARAKSQLMSDSFPTINST